MKVIKDFSSWGNIKVVTATLLTLISFSAISQNNQKKQLKIADYELWSTLKNENISSTGLWVSYSINYNSKKDTVFVVSSDTKKKYVFPKAKNGKFNRDNWYACIMGKNELHVTALKSGKKDVIENVSDFEFSNSGEYLIAIGKTKNTKSAITLIKLSNGERNIVENTNSWRFNDDKSYLVYSVVKDKEDRVVIISLNDKTKSSSQVLFKDAQVSNIVWKNNNESIIFVLKSGNISENEKADNTKLALYHLHDKTTFFLDPTTVNNFPLSKQIESSSNNDIRISDDGKRVFFQLIPNIPPEKQDEQSVEIWNGEDKLVYSERKQLGSLDNWAKTAVWFPEKNEVFHFMEQDTHLKLSGNQLYALTSNVIPCEVQFQYTPDRNYYLTNLITRERKVWMNCYSGEMSNIIMSPCGNYIAYFKNKDWYIYIIESGEHKNCTTQIEYAFYDEDNDVSDNARAYGFIGWSTNSTIFLNDKYDIWEVDINGNKTKRITNGRELDVRYRVVKSNTQSNRKHFLSVADSKIINSNAPLLLQASSTDTLKEGYFISQDGKQKPLQFAKHKVKEFKKAPNAEVYSYLKEDYNNPTSLQIIQKNSNKANTIVLSNPQHYNYQWGTVTTINYTSSKGKNLKGLVYYPSNYKKGNVYPMIVNVYEKKSHLINNYINPTMQLYDGFNVTNLVTQGYAVLLPDIEYESGSPGDSAVDCVTAAVNSALELGFIDKDKIGLIGHSFGGYETSYIISKTNLFKTAIAGAAQTNYISGYLHLSQNYKKAEFWRYEYYTNRMGKSLFEDMSGYLSNSPIHNAVNIQTPLLLWTGANDGHVSPLQSMELYLALRRLSKKVIMLRYPNEDHQIFKPSNQVNLSHKVMEWFDYYLKDKPLSQWMKAF